MYISKLKKEQDKDNDNDLFGEQFHWPNMQNF